MTGGNQLRGRMAFGDKPGQGGGVPVTITLETDQMQDRTPRPTDDVGKGPSGETADLRPERFEIRVLSGRSGKKYSWEKVDNLPEGVLPDYFGGSTYDSIPACERFGRTDVPPGSLVEAVVGPTGRFLLFTYHGPTLVRCDSNTVTSSRQPGTILIPDGAGGYAEGDEVRMKLSPAAGSGDAFRTPGQYWMQYNGDVTIGDDTFPLYTGPGSIKVNVGTCESGVTGYRECWFPAWTEIGSFVAGSPP
jgi:hypothetical protein